MSRVSTAISSVVSEIKKTTKNIHPVTSPIADLRSPSLTSWQIEVYFGYSDNIFIKWNTLLNSTISYGH